MQHNLKMDLKREFFHRKIKQETEAEPYNNISDAFVTTSNVLHIKFEDTTYASHEPEDQIENALEAITADYTEVPNQLKECKTIPLARNLDVEEISNRQICRLCALPITNTEIFLYEDTDLEQKITYTLPITMGLGDGLPEYICQNCEINVNMFYDFVCQVVNADKAIRTRTRVNPPDVKTNDVTSATIKQIFGADPDELEEEDVNEDEDKFKCPQCGRLLEAPDSKHVCDLKVPTIKVSDRKPSKHLLEDDDGDKLRKIQKISILNPQKPNLSEAQFKCASCEQSFPDYFTLVRHSKESHGKPRYPCLESDCSEVFNTEKSLRQHIHDNHNVPVICHKCGKIFNHQTALEKHEDNVHFFKVCDKCGMSFKSLFSFNTHRLLHMKVGEHQCVYCYKNFKIRHKLHRHTRQSHSGNFTLLVDMNEDEVDRNLLTSSK